MEDFLWDLGITKDTALGILISCGVAILALFVILYGLLKKSSPEPEINSEEPIKQPKPKTEEEKQAEYKSALQGHYILVRARDGLLYDKIFAQVTEELKGQEIADYVKEFISIFDRYFEAENKELYEEHKKLQEKDKK